MVSKQFFSIFSLFRDLFLDFKVVHSCYSGRCTSEPRRQPHKIHYAILLLLANPFKDPLSYRKYWKLFTNHFTNWELPRYTKNSLLCKTLSGFVFFKTKLLSLPKISESVDPRTGHWNFMVPSSTGYKISSKPHVSFYEVRISLSNFRSRNPPQRESQIY